jgi:PPOX class probable F420-dependent enzyme
MDISDALGKLETMHHAVICTRRRDGSPQMSPVTCGVDGDGRVVVSSRETAMKVKHLRRDPSMALCVFTDRFFGPWVQVEGTAQIESLPEAMDGLVDYYRRVAGEHPNWDDYRQAMVDEQRVLIRLAVERAGPDLSG